MFYGDLFVDLEVSNVPLDTSLYHLYCQGPLVHLFSLDCTFQSYPSCEEDFKDGALIANSYISIHVRIWINSLGGYGGIEAYVFA